ncbi:restriction endonuclease [Paenibacillus sp. PsM32]|uniref:restriction endonuclease n=1 Tax=Paenibacillus sp. PsM32 TaxID=3030536 RepID=UPI00263A4445|nr:restriction endonuclease [Paenibacillus sp. PsM32]MDN4617855.1 restriction endonuclease [Paenibacillus sp. PsM32]
MARRKSKKKQQQESANAIGGLIIFGGIGVSYFAKSIAVGVVAIVLGIIVFALISYSINQARINKLRRSGIAEIDKMSGDQFEHYLGQLFKLQGYNATVTQAQGDYGADLVLNKDGKRIVVQAKRYSKNVGLKAVQEVYGAIAHYKASAGWVVTNSRYTPQARTLARSNNVRLVDREELVEMILRVKESKKAN